MTRRALVSHIVTYTVAFVPALIWLYGSDRLRAIGVAALIAIPHPIQDNGRLQIGSAGSSRRLTSRPVRSSERRSISPFSMALFLVRLIAAS